MAAFWSMLSQIQLKDFLQTTRVFFVDFVNMLRIFGESIFLFTYFIILYVQNKQYPRDSFKDAFCKGRVRIQLKNSDGTPFNEKYPTSKLCCTLFCILISWSFELNFWHFVANRLKRFSHFHYFYDFINNYRVNSS